MNPLTIIS